MLAFINDSVKISIFQNLLFIFVFLITVIAAINLCAKKRGSGKIANNSGNAVGAAAGNATSSKATLSKKSVKQLSHSPGKTKPSTPTATTTTKKSPDENGNFSADKVVINNEKGSVNNKQPSAEEKEKLSKESGKKTVGGGGGKDDTDDSFDSHKPVVREAKRAEEIKKRGFVDQKRKDYKTLRNDLLSSDFDKSLGLPELEDKKK